MAGPNTTPKPSTPAAPPAANTSSWKDKFKDYFKPKDKPATKQTATDKTESKSVLSKIKDNTKDVVGKLVKLFVGSDEIDGLTKKSPPQKILKGIVKLLAEIEAQKKSDYADDRRSLKQEERESNRRHKEILKALTVRRKPAEKKPTKKAEAKPAETKPAKPAEAKPAETKPAKPAEAKPAETKPAKQAETKPAEVKTKTAEPVTTQAPSPTATPAPISTPTAAVVTAATGLTISANALASMKGEQNVHSAKEALAPVTDPKISKSHGIPIGVGKIGAATPDVQNSTSYGLFGINNIRTKDKNGKSKAGSSSIDAFVKMSPELGLPTPGDPDDPSSTKTFNEAWWKVSKEKPEDMLKAQLKFFKQKFWFWYWTNSSSI